MILFFQKYRKKKVANKKFNDHLKKIAKRAGIQKKVTMHIARHSFGNIAADNIHPLMLQKLYRHTDLKTTINYQANYKPRTTIPKSFFILSFNYI